MKTLKPNLDNLKRLRKSHGLNKKEMAAELGWNYQTYWNKESGKTEFTLSEAYQVAWYFDMKIDKLFYSRFLGTLKRIGG
ncbi:MAG: helix-turn-helix transcriptional regulator [bacterium]